MVIICRYIVRKYVYKHDPDNNNNKMKIHIPFFKLAIYTLMISGDGNFVFSLRCPLKALRTASSTGTAILYIVLLYFVYIYVRPNVYIR